MGSGVRSVVSGWQLLLLASTGVVLSVASGWTTWDGMRNFTNEPLLSLMITFGIQGVMLIAAWLIGESFAAAKDQRHLGMRTAPRRFGLITGTGLGIVVALSLGLLLFAPTGMFFQGPGGSGNAGFWSAPASPFNLVLIAALVAALFLVVAGRDIIDGYLQSMRVIVRHAVLWVMFLACMATSVFFSFDSLFSTIFSDSERLRAADVRARSEVAGIVNDVVELTSRRQLEQRTALLASTPWRDYAGILDRLASELQAAPQAIDQYLLEGALEEQEAVVRQQAKISSIEGDMAQLSRRKVQLAKLAEQLQGRAAQFETKVDALNGQIFEKDREVIAKTAEAEAEASGIGVTSRPGRGPKYRELTEQLERLEEEKKNLELRLSAYTKRLDTARQAIADNESEVASVETELQQLKGRVSTVNAAGGPRQQAKWASALRSTTQTALQQLKGDRIAFEQNPTRARLDALQSRCSEIVDTMSGSPLLTSTVAAGSCDPGKTHEAAARLYALNSGAQMLGARCGGAGLSDTAGVEPQIALARNCLQHARLLPTDTAAITADINALERNRDDLAHRFVVTINAFSDGNNLAYLALAIAIAIDALVFMSGLFGANAAHAAGPAMPQFERRIDRQAEAMLQSALLPDVFENAASALEVVKPVGNSAGAAAGPGWSHEIDLDDGRIISPGSLRKALNAGVAAGVVECDPAHQEKYFLKPEFIELLCSAAQHAFTNNQGNPGFSDLTLHAGTVLAYLHPSLERDGYSFQLVMSEVKAEDAETVQRCLNAVAPLNCIRRSGPESESVRYLIHKDLHRILSFMSAGVASAGDAANTGSTALLSDRAVRRVELGSAAPGRPQEPTPAPESRSFGKRPTLPQRRGASQAAETARMVARDPLTGRPVERAASRTMIEDGDGAKAKEIRPGAKAPRPGDAIGLD